MVWMSSISSSLSHASPLNILVHLYILVGGRKQVKKKFSNWDDSKVMASESEYSVKDSWLYLARSVSLVDDHLLTFLY